MRTHCKRSGRLALLFVACLATLSISLVGCKRNQFPLTPVEGKVVYRNKPLEFGNVIFQPTSSGRPAMGRIQSDGSFVLSTHSPGDGAQIGKHRVIVTCYEGQRGQNGGAQADESSGGLGKLLIPMRYTLFDGSGIEVDVAPNCPPVMIELTD